VFADESFGALDFSPPASDVSVEFLGYLFGNVEGVLSSSGSQIAGKMFAVLNSAVLALGGLLVAYTLIVSTMNTAHEGEILGKKWSSIWTPTRVCVGLTLLLPRASGYCTAQVFVMWIVVQGVGAGDKIWNAALDYLGSGGVIISQGTNTDTASSETSGGVNSITQAAGGILSGQVCMLAMQYQYEKIYDIVKKDSGSSSASAKACNNVSWSTTNATAANQYTFCLDAVPDFLSTVNFDYNNLTVLSSSGSNRYVLPMPNFNTPSSCNSGNLNSCSSPGTSDYFYSQLNGVCGVISWAQGTSSLTNGNVSTDEWDSTVSVAAGQLYSSLQTVAETMIAASPFANSDFTSNTEYSSFGFPRTPSDTTCKPSKNSSAVSCTGTNATSSCDQDYQNSPACLSWGGIQGVGTLFSGDEIEDGVNIYMGVVDPMLVMISMGGSSEYQDLTSFIDSAKSQGWILAGSYYLNLSNLNDVVAQSGASNSVGITGLAAGSGCDKNNNFGTANSSTYSASASYSTGGPTCSNSAASDAISLLSGGMRLTDIFNPVDFMLATYVSGSGYTTANPLTTIPSLPVTDNTLFQDQTSVSPSDDYSNTTAYYSMCTTNPYPGVLMLYNSSNPSTNSGSYSSSAVTNGNSTCVGVPLTNNTFAFYTNANAFYTPSTSTGAPEFELDIRIQAAYPPFSLDNVSVGSGKWGFGFIVRWMANEVIIPILNQVMQVMSGYLSQMLMVLLTPPLMLLTGVFPVALSFLDNPAVNPIMALAAMGATYINGIANLWFIMIIPMAMVALLPFGVAMAVCVILLIAMPIVFSWYAVMFSIGCVCAYYLPFLPYMIFTFAAIGWFIGVIEAMTAAPIVALGVATPEGHEAFGKSAQAIMIILNVFLRPGMMIIGYIFAFSLSYVGIWLVNAGFSRMQSNLWTADLPTAPDTGDTFTGQVNDWTGGAYDTAVGYANYATYPVDQASSELSSATNNMVGGDSVNTGAYGGTYIYTQWASIFFYFFIILVYTTMMIAVVQKAYELIHILPDKILRWLSGGQQESLGSESAGMVRDIKQQADTGAAKSYQGVEESAAVATDQAKKLGKEAAGGGDASVS
jgi:defect-in-organelle-trafficking protein DotA